MGLTSPTGTCDDGGDDGDGSSAAGWAVVSEPLTWGETYPEVWTAPIDAPTVAETLTWSV